MDAAVVPRRPSAADRHRVVAEPPPTSNRRTTHQSRRPTMNMIKRTIGAAVACGALAALLIYANAAQPLKLDFSDETVGGEPKSFLSVVGVWRIEAEGNNKVLAVDGRQWKEGQTSAGIADKARALYGDRYAEFLDRVQAYAYFPYVVATARVFRLPKRCQGPFGCSNGSSSTSASHAMARRSLMSWRRRGSANGGRLANGRHAQAAPQKAANGLDELGHRDWLRQIGFATALAYALLIALHRESGHRDHWNDL